MNWDLISHLTWRANNMANVSSSNGLENRPKLRFPGFDEPWNEVELSHVLCERNEYAEKDGAYDHVTLSKDGIYAKTARYDRDFLVSTENKKYKVTHYSDLCYNPANLKFGAICLNTYGDAIFSPIYITFEINKNYDANFIGANLTRYNFINYALRFQQGTVYERMAVSPEDFLSIKCFFPNEREQKKISSFVGLLDKRIAKQQQLIDTLKKYKRGVFEAVFSQKMRLAPQKAQKPWKHYKISEFATRVIRKNGKQTDIPLTISAQYGLIDQRDFFSKVVASTDMSGYYLLKNGEYAYNRSTSNDYPFGSIKRLELYPMGAVSTLYICFCIKDDKLNSDLVKWYFESSQWHKGINKICAEGARNHGLLNVPTDGFFNTVHCLPSDTREQTAIAEFLSNIQRKYETSQRQLQAIESLRTGLLQQLFI